MASLASVEPSSTLQQPPSQLQQPSQLQPPSHASGNRLVADFKLFDTQDPQVWEQVYTQVLNPKYQKNSRNYHLKPTPMVGKYPQNLIFLIPRQRAGPSYKSVKLENVNNDDVFFAPISKGYSMQDVSSFSLGPIVGAGLCLVNSAFSKSVAPMHLMGGHCDLKRKNFWHLPRNVDRSVEYINETHMKVDDQVVNTLEWLDTNSELWLDEWTKWSRSVALCSEGDFHWTDEMCVTFRHRDQYLKFVDWKKQCYIQPSYDLLPHNRVYQLLHKVMHEFHQPLGLVHPKACCNEAQKPMTQEYLRQLFDDPDDMCCQPYVVAGKLLDVPVYA